MLQQTQVDRVIPKYEAFVRRWPTPAKLAAAPLGEVLAAWSGLGYNRRAQHLHEAAKAVMARHDGIMPVDADTLLALPGVGPYTSRAVASFAANADVALWDTNVRRIFFRLFFGGEFAFADPTPEEFQKLLDVALPRGRSREWHGALMDFGSAVCVNRSPQCGSCPLARTCLAAPHYLAGRQAPRSLVKKQAKFEGSRRQARGAVLRLLTVAGPSGLTEHVLLKHLDRPESTEILADLVKEGMVARKGSRLRLPE